MGISLIIGMFFQYLPSLAIDSNHALLGVKKYALGYPTPTPPDLTPEAIFSQKLPQITITQKIQFLFQLLMISAQGLIKLSIVALYRRIFVHSNKSAFGITTLIAYFILTCWTLGFLLAFAFNCRLHFFALWGSELDLLKYCNQGFGGEQAIVISDFLIDIFLLIMPLPMIFRLHLSVWKRVGLVGVFLLGGIAIAASIVRLAVIMAITSRGFDYTEDEDLTVGTALYWGMIETGLALVAACLPTVSSGITKPFGRLISTTRSLFSLQSRSTKTGSSAKGIQSANQYYEMDQTSIAASKLSTGAQSREGEANFRTEEHFTGDIEAARLRP
ncbi:hypothetical protein ACHAO8_010729 [Botrytis cinerea]